MILLGILVLVAALAAAVVGWLCFGTVTSAVVSFLVLFLPGVYFLYQNLQGGSEKPASNEGKKNSP